MIDNSKNAKKSRDSITASLYIAGMRYALWLRTAPMPEKGQVVQLRISNDPWRSERNTYKVFQVTDRAFYVQGVRGGQIDRPWHKLECLRGTVDWRGVKC